MATIELKDLTKHYRQGKNLIKALDGVTLNIGEGEFVSVVGRSGSGKTTMLDLVGLLMRPTAGTLTIDGVDTARLKDGQRADLRGRRIGFIFQEYNLLPALNVLENVMLPLRYNGGGKEGRARALELLDRVGLGDRLHSRADELSGGQQQRVAIARALVNRPALVLADEPTGAVDTQTADELISLMRDLNRADELVSLMRRLNREESVTFVVVTHDLDLAARTDRVIRLKDGAVLADERQEMPMELAG
jgi:putative ABC transport system ATP-binding protein